MLIKSSGNPMGADDDSLNLSHGHEHHGVNCGSAKNKEHIIRYEEGRKFYLNQNYLSKKSNALFQNLEISEYCVAFFATVGLFISIANYEQS